MVALRRLPVCASVVVERARVVLRLAWLEASRVPVHCPSACVLGCGVRQGVECARGWHIPGGGVLSGEGRLPYKGALVT